MRLSMRPARMMTLSVNREQALGRFNSSLKQGELLGEVLGNHVTLKVSDEVRHFWSPWLQIEFRDGEGDGIRGCSAMARFSPHPSIWTGFALSHLGLITLATLALCFGIAQVSVGYEPVAFWAVPVCLMLNLILFIASQIGQWLAREQMEQLRDQMDDLLKDVIQPSQEVS